MRARLHGAVWGAASGLMIIAGCRAIEGIDGLRFDLVSSPDGGGGSTGSAGNGGGAVGAGGAPCAAPGDDCNAPPPAGWKGPVALYEGPPDTAPECAGAYTLIAARGQTGLDAPPASCATCTCSTPGVTCGQEALQFFSQPTCHGGPETTLTLTPGTCTQISGNSGKLMQTPPQANVSACTPGGGGVSDLPPLTWTTSGVVCGLGGQATACAGGSLCAPAPPGGFAPRWCIWQTGDQSCPNAFPQKHAWEEQATDDRGCTSCTCGPSAATCDVTTVLYGDTTCTNELSSIGEVGKCTPLGSAQSVVATTTPAASPTCPAGGGTPTGSATSTTVVTICCPS